MYRSRIFLSAPLVFAFLALVAVARGETGGDALAVFKRRILPIFESRRPSSCTECHLSSVELRDYIRPNQAETYAGLRAAGLIDEKAPEKSKILEFIRRESDRPRLVVKDVRQQEYDAFLAWIQAAANDPTLHSLPPAKPIGPAVPKEIVRHGRRDRILESFVDNVWSEVGRCAACHSPLQNQKQVAKFGKRVSWIRPDDPAGTFDYLVEKELIRADKPAESFILLKPTMQVEHGGGQKMLIGDRSYRQFLRFLEDYSATVNAEYQSAAQLPKRSDEVSTVSDQWIKLEGVPAKYDKMPLRVELFRIEDGLPSDSPWATADRAVFGGGQLWQNHLSLVGKRGSDWAAELVRTKRLPPGRYMLHVYIDKEGKLELSNNTTLTIADRVAQIPVESNWPVGYGKMTVVRVSFE